MVVTCGCGCGCHDVRSGSLLNDSSSVLFGDNGGCCGSAWGQHEELEML